MAHTELYTLEAKQRLLAEQGMQLLDFGVGRKRRDEAR